MLRDEISFRTATLADAAELAAFGSESFVAVYGYSMSPGNLALHVTRTYSEENQARELADPLAWTMLGEREGELVGAALLRWAPPPEDLAPELRWAEIARFYLSKAYWQTGVSTDLMIEVLHSIREREGLLVWLQVWERAERALRFYRKWGFLEIGAAPFRAGTELQRDLVMARSLRPSHAERPTT